MHIIEPDCKGVQAEYLNEREDVATEREGKRGGAGHRPEGQKHKDQGGEQGSGVHLLVGRGETIKQVLHY